MSSEIAMPQLGETVTEGTITRWFKRVGDKVEEDEVLFEVSTDKVDSEVPSPTSGYVSEILVQEGETVDVGAKLAVIGDAPPDQQGGGAAGATAPSPAPEEAPPAEGGHEIADEDTVGDAAEAASQAEQAGATEPEATVEAARPAPVPSPSEAAPEQRGDGGGARGAPGGNGGGNGGGKVLSPVVRRLIAEHGLDPAQIPGTGVGGRITRADVLGLIDARSAGAATSAPPPAPAPASRVATGPVEAVPDADGAPAAAPEPVRARGDEVVAFSNIRRRTAEHMRRSLDTSTHALVVIDVDYEAVDKVRVPAKERFKAEEGVSLTYLPFVARAVVDAIRQFPHVNASVGQEELVVHGHVNLGIAVDLSHEGLIVPVVHDADGKRLRLLAREMADLAARARAKKLGADDISGGTFTITNPGGYGTLLTAPIINQPQVAILSTDGVKPKPVAVPLAGGGFGIAVHPVGNLAIAFDHRAYDGAYAAAFLARVKEILETRDWSQELA